MTEFKDVLFGCCFALSLLLIYREYKRPDKAHLIWRLIFSLLAIICLAFLLSPPSYKSTVTQQSDLISLFTTGTEVGAIHKIKGKKYTLTTEIKGHGIERIQDLDYFLASHPDIKRIDIYGYGVSPSTLEKLSPHQVSFFPPEGPSGIVSAGWQHQLKTSETLIVEGNYQNTGTSAIQLFLRGLGKNIDSVTIPAHTTTYFSFRNLPKQSGKAVYQLISLKDADTLSSEPVPFEVRSQEPLRLLILASSPDFEYKFLKKWLYENQFPLALRSKISKDKYAFEFLNTEKVNLKTLNAATLRKFDLLIADEEELTSLNENEKIAITDAVNGGLGILLRVSNEKPLTGLGRRFARSTDVRKDKTFNLQAMNSNLKFKKLTYEPSLSLRLTADQQVLIGDQSHKALVGTGIFGMGKVSATTILQTYNWILAGNTGDYSSYWSYLISKSARAKKTAATIRIIPQFPQITKKSRLIVGLHEANAVPSLVLNYERLSPRQNMELPFQWDAFFWPVQSGWNSLKVNSKLHHFYVYQPNDWQALKNQELININKQFVKDRKLSKKLSRPENKMIEKTLSKWWFLVGFLVSVAFLWIEPRLKKPN